MLEIEPLAQDGELGLTRVQADGPHERYTCKIRACTSPVCPLSAKTPSKLKSLSFSG